MAAQQETTTAIDHLSNDRSNERTSIGKATSSIISYNGGEDSTTTPQDNQNNDNQDVPKDSNTKSSTRQRPPLDYSSFSAFKQSLKVRIKSIFTRKFCLLLLAGQFVSFCIMSTSLCTTELGNRNWNLPTTQTFFVYFTLFAVYTPFTIYNYGFKPWARMVLTDGWKYFILAAVDVEANYAVVKAYQYTDLLAAMLLNCWATPVCMIMAFFLVKARYHWTQIIGVLICVGGLGMTVASEQITGKNYDAPNRPLGNGLMIIGATLYGVSNSLEEFFVKQRPVYEAVGQLGMWATIINGVQSAGLEHNDMPKASWNGATVGILIAYTFAMLCLYTCAPLVFRMSSGAFYNLNVLTSNFYSLLFGLFLYHYSPYWLYFVSFAVVMIGLIIYFSVQSPENQGKVDVKARGKRAQKENEANQLEGQNDLQESSNKNDALV